MPRAGHLGILARGTLQTASLFRCHGLPWSFRSAVLPHIRLPFRPGSLRPPVSLTVGVSPVSPRCPQIPPVRLDDACGLGSYAVSPDISSRPLCALCTTVDSSLLPAPCSFLARYAGPGDDI